MGGQVRTSRQHLHELGRTLHAVSPLATMGRGYAILTDTASGRVISLALEVVTGAKVSAQLSDGRLDCTVDSIEQETL